MHCLCFYVGCSTRVCAPGCGPGEEGSSPFIQPIRRVQSMRRVLCFESTTRPWSVLIPSLILVIFSVWGIIQPWVGGRNSATPYLVGTPREPMNQSNPCCWKLWRIGQTKYTGFETVNGGGCPFWENERPRWRPFNSKLSENLPRNVSKKYEPGQVEIGMQRAKFHRPRSRFM